MENRQSKLDTLRRHLANTPTEEKEIRCLKCEQVGLEIWTKAEERHWKLLGKDQIAYIQPERVYGDFDRYCDQCRETIEIERDEKLRELEKKKRWNDLVDRMGGGVKAAQDFTFEKYDPMTPSQKIALEACLGFNPKTENLYLVGPAGVGKSHLACATAHTCFDQGTYFRRWRVPELLRFFRIKRNAEEEEKLILSHVNVGILVIEDLGTQKETDWGTSLLWEIIDRRLEAGINGLIVTTNLGRGDMAEHIGDRIPSRLSALCNVVKIDGRDMRLENKDYQDGSSK